MRALPCLLIVSCATLHHTNDPRAAVEKLLRDQYAAVERGDLDAWGAAMAPDAFLWGSDPKEVFVGRDAILAAMKKNAAGRMGANVQRTYHSNGLVVGMAPGDRSAWVADEIDYTAGPRKVHFRMTALVEERDGRYVITAAHYSVPITHADSFDKLAAGDLPPPADVGDAIAPGAERPVELFKRGTEHPSGENLSERDDVVVIGTAPDEHWSGGRAIRDRLAQIKMPANVRLEPTGGIRAALAADGQTAWVAGNVMLILGLGGSEVRLPFRTMEIYLKEGAFWHLACAHSSVAIPD